LPQPAYPEAAVMMTFVNMDSDGLVILPTHRVVYGLPHFDPVAFAIHAQEFFTVEPLETDDAVNSMELLRSEEGTAFIAATEAGALLLHSKPEAVAATLAGLPERQRQLDLSQLHSIVLDRLLGLDAEKVREQTNIRYLRDPGECRLPHQPRLDGATARGGLCRRRNAAEVHRLLPQAAQRFDHLCAGLEAPSGRKSFELWLGVSAPAK
jgi:hypothetical protein